MADIPARVPCADSWVARGPWRCARAAFRACRACLAIAAPYMARAFPSTQFPLSRVASISVALRFLFYGVTGCFRIVSACGLRLQKRRLAAALQSGWHESQRYREEENPT